MTNQESQSIRQQRTNRAEREFSAAADLAKARGWSLVKHTPHHYQFVDPNGGILNVYPSTQKAINDSKRPTGVCVGQSRDEWNLIDLAKSVAPEPTRTADRAPWEPEKETLAQIKDRLNRSLFAELKLILIRSVVIFLLVVAEVAIARWLWSLPWREL